MVACRLVPDFRYVWRIVGHFCIFSRVSRHFSGFTKQHLSPMDVVITSFFGVDQVMSGTTCVRCASSSPMWCQPIDTTMRALAFRPASHLWYKQWQTSQVTTFMTEWLDQPNAWQHTLEIMITLGIPHHFKWCRCITLIQKIHVFSNFKHFCTQPG